MALQQKIKQNLKKYWRKLIVRIKELSIIINLLLTNNNSKNTQKESKISFKKYNITSQIHMNKAKKPKKSI